MHMEQEDAGNPSGVRTERTASPVVFASVRKQLNKQDIGVI
jgi:hypothetical protein